LSVVLAYQIIKISNKVTLLKYWEKLQSKSYG
jgi:hypothetical protein